MKKSKNLVASPADIDDLHCRLVMFGHLMSRNRGSCGLRAIKRLQSAIRNNRAEPLTREAYISRFPDLSERHLGEEFDALFEISELPAVPLPLAERMVALEATMADAIVAIDLHLPCSLARTQHRNAALRFCKALQMPPEAAPADGRFVTRSFRKLQPGDFATSLSGFNTIRSRVRRAVRHVDLYGSSYDRKEHITGPWKKLADGLDAAGCKRLRLNLWPLIRFCHGRNIQPAAVNDQVVNDLIADITDRSVREPFEVARKVVYAWQKAQRSIRGFPNNKLSRLYKTKSGTSLNFEGLPAAFRASWSEFVDKVGAANACDPADVFDDIDTLLSGGLPLSASISAGSIPNIRTAITYAARAHASPEELSSIDEVLNPECLIGAIKAAHDRQKAMAIAKEMPFPSPKNSHLKNIAQNTLLVARHCNIDKDVLQELRDIAWRVDPDITKFKRGRDGQIRPCRQEPTMGRRHRERLREFAKAGKLAAFLSAPEKLLSLANDKSKQPGFRQCAALNAAVHAILRSAPIRRRNLAEIRLFGADCNLQIIPSESRAVLYLDASETKGRNSLTIEISGAHYAVLKQWIERHRSDLAQSVGAHPENRYLFPANGLTSRHLSLMNQKFRQHNERLGFTMNLHLARHVTAKIALDRGLDIATVSQLLGHESIKTTERHYAECVELFAQREYHRALIETKIGTTIARAA